MNEPKGMKNFEAYIDTIAVDYENQVTACWIADLNHGLCFYYNVPCSECFKKWALQESEASHDAE
jgi:hypothetical protein